MSMALSPDEQAAVDEVMNDTEQLSEHFAGETPIAIRRAAVESMVARREADAANDFIAERARRIYLHPAAGAHWQAASELFVTDTISTAQAIAALSAIAASGGVGRAN